MTILTYIYILLPSSNLHRVMLPLLKTLELLLEEGAFDNFTMPESQQFAEKLLIAVRMELRRSRQINKLCVGANVVVCIAAYCELVRDEAFALAIALLGHRVSRRKAMLYFCCVLYTHSLYYVCFISCWLLSSPMYVSTLLRLYT